MKTNTIATAALLSAASVHAATQTVQVGQRGLVFQPDSVTAAQGDVIEFVIHTTHNVARSPFNNPCQPVTGSTQSIWSGANLKDGTIFSVTINDTNPVWLYCATGQHCQDGMAMVINPSGSDTLSAYKAAATNVVNTGEPTVIAGGVYGAPSGGSSPSSSTGSPSSSAGSPSSSSGGASSSSAGQSTTAGGASATSSGASMTTRMGGASSTTSAGATASTTNAASNLMADIMMVGGAIFGGAVLLM